MQGRSQSMLGIAALAFAAFLLLVGIPQGVTSPSNVSNIVLSPTFWPRILAVLLALTGAGLLLTPRRAAPIETAPLPRGGDARLLAMAVLMVGYVLLMPRLGMVWTSMLAFIAVAFLMRTRHPLPAVAAGVVVPLLLYAFFAHVAGVAVPQGDFVRLP